MCGVKLNEHLVFDADLINHQVKINAVAKNSCNSSSIFQIPPTSSAQVIVHV